MGERCAVCGASRGQHVAASHRFHAGVDYMDDDHGCGGIGGHRADCLDLAETSDAMAPFAGDDGAEW